MTKHAQPQSTITPSGAVVFGFDPANLESVMQQYTTWLEELGRVQQESLEFMRARLARDAEAAARMAECKTPADLMQWQISYTKDTVEDYMRQGQKITTLLMQSTNGGTHKSA